MLRKKRLRSRSTLDIRLWQQLKALEGTRFRKRAPFRTFILDFVEHDARLAIILLDGAPGSPQPVHVARDTLLNQQGYVILRLWRQEVERDLHGAVHTIRAVLA